MRYKILKTFKRLNTVYIGTSFNIKIFNILNKNSVFAEKLKQLPLKFRITCVNINITQNVNINLGIDKDIASVSVFQKSQASY